MSTSFLSSARASGFARKFVRSLAGGRAATLAVAGLLLVACGDEDETPSGTPTPLLDAGTVTNPFADAGPVVAVDGATVADTGSAPVPCDPASQVCTPVTVDGGGTPSPDASTTGEQGEDCEASFELRAYDKAAGGDKFPVPLQKDHYECFYFKADVPAGQLATSLSPLLDDTRVLHHWLLFASDKEEKPSGTHALCNGIHPQAYLMASWLPGTPALVLPTDVGMEMPSGPTAQFILENHYNNSANYTDSSDRSGVKVCATNKPKGTHAAIHWLGSETIYLAPNVAGSAQGKCVPSGNDPVHIMGVIPHMHRLGRHVTMTIARANGTSEILHEGAFDFDNQGFYKKDVVLNKGDTVTTKCDYMNTTGSFVTLGESTGNEMCYMFTVAYPVGSMNTGGPYVQGPNRCMR